MNPQSRVKILTSLLRRLVKETGKFGEDLRTRPLPDGRCRRGHQPQESVCSCRVHGAVWTLKPVSTGCRGMTRPRVRSRISAVTLTLVPKRQFPSLGMKRIQFEGTHESEEITVGIGSHREVNNKDNATNPDSGAAAAEL